MSTESNMPAGAGQQGVQTQGQDTTVSTTTQAIPPVASNDGIFNYEDSPHRAVKPDETQTGDKPIFGKYKTMDEAQTGYKSAEAKIREQGTKLNEITKQLEDYKPMESYAEDKWNENVQKWVAEKSLPEGMTYDPNIPEINMLIKGFEKAGVSEKQAKTILAGAVERQVALIEERKSAIMKELGSDGLKKVAALETFASKLSPEDQAAFSALFAFPYVETPQVDLMYRLMCGEGERSIPTNVATAPLESSADIYRTIMNFRKENERSLMTDTGLQQQEEAMWEKYNAAKKKGF
jgi:hypothetical protein